jgi:hypothetical protein
MAAISIVMDVYSTSLTLLSLQIMNKSKNKANENEIIADILQLMGILAHLEGLNLLQYVSECVLRSVLLACGSPHHFSDYKFLHAACCTIYQAICNSARLMPGSLTYGAYAMALSAFKKAQLKCTGAVSIEPYINPNDNFMHLQDVGLAWFSDNSSAWFPDCDGVRSRTITEDFDIPKPESNIVSSPSRSPVTSSLSPSLGSSPKTDLWARLSSNFAQSSSNPSVKTPTKAASRTHRYESLTGTPIRLAERLMYRKNQALFGLTIPSCYEFNCYDPDCVICESIHVVDSSKAKRRASTEVFPGFAAENCGIDNKFVENYVSDIRKIKFLEAYEPDLVVESPSVVLAPVHLQNRICFNELFSIKVAAKTTFPADSAAAVEGASIETTYFLNVFASSALGRVFTICLKVDESSANELTLLPVDFTKLLVAIESVDHETLQFEFRRVVIVTISSTDIAGAIQDTKTTKSSSVVLGHGSIRVRDFPLNVTTRITIRLCDTPSPMSPTVAFVEMALTRSVADPEPAVSVERNSFALKAPTKTSAKSPISTENTGWKNMMTKSISKLTKNIPKIDGPIIAPHTQAPEASRSASVMPNSTADSGGGSSDNSSEATNKPSQSQIAETAQPKKSYSSMFNAFSSKVMSSTAALMDQLPDKIFDSNKASSAALASVVKQDPEDFELKDFVPNSMPIVEDDIDSSSSSTHSQHAAKSGNVDLLDMPLADTAVDEVSSDLASSSIQNDLFSDQNEGVPIPDQSVDLLGIDSETAIESKEKANLHVDAFCDAAADVVYSFDRTAGVSDPLDSAVVGGFDLSSDSADCGISNQIPRRGTFDSDILIDPPGEESTNNNVIEEPLPELISNRSIYQRASHRSNLTKLSSAGRALGVFSGVTCPSCGFIFQDEEILSAWTSASSSLSSKGSIESSILGRNRAEYFEDLHRIKCLSCSEYVDPKLQIREYRVVNSSVEIGYSTSVTMLSSFCLRFTIEYLINIFGPSVLHHNFSVHFPELFWSLKWYSQRVHCPNGFESNSAHSPPFPEVLLPLPENAVSSVDAPTSDLFFGPIIYGWRESNVRHRAERMLLPERQNTRNSPRAHDVLQSYFPFASEETLAMFEEVASKYLDGSTEGMRRAIMRVFPCCSGPLFTSGSNESRERNVYIVLMVLALTTEARSKLGKYSNNMPVDLEKVTYFYACHMCITSVTHLVLSSVGRPV